VDALILMCGVALGTGLALVVVRPRLRPTPSIRRWLDAAGLAGVRTSMVFVVCGSVAVLIGSVVATIMPIPALAPLAAVAGVGIPIIALTGARDARRETARAAWPDVIDAIRVALRSGSTMIDALATAEALVPRSWSGAWHRMTVDLRRGAELDRALEALRASLADPIADRVIESLLVGRDLGGAELPVVLTELARTVRRDVALRREVRARQSWVRNAARLGVAAPWVVLVLLASRPENRAAYSTPGGTMLLLAVAGATVIAHAVMSGLGTLREPNRWLLGERDA
jgi:tight adherence protein B